jgi:putative transposase
MKEDSPLGNVPWPHAPLHVLSESGTYIVTAGTYQKHHYFRGRERLEVLHRGLLKVAEESAWKLEAWAVFSNHYHFIGHSPSNDTDAKSLSPMLNKLHERTAIWINRMDHAPGRKVWFNFRETRLTYEKSYLARLHYVHHNAVKHGVVKTASQYPWCSAGWFERTASAAQLKLIYGFKTDSIRVFDEYEVSGEW